MLDEYLPQIERGCAPCIPQDHGNASYFSRRSPDDGAIDWKSSSGAIRNLVRAVTRPYPGAFTYRGDTKIYVWEAAQHGAAGITGVPGRVHSIDPLVVQCGQGALEVRTAQVEGDIYRTGAQLAKEINLVPGTRLGPRTSPGVGAKTRVLILGVNGFIGNALTERLLASGRHEVHGMDLNHDSIRRFHGERDFYFHEGDISIHREWIEYHVKKCDVVVPLIAIATPVEYIRNPLRVFELDFEENLRIVRYCVKYNKRVVFPSTSEVYGMCDDPEFSERTSRLVLGPVHKQRWIYACSKQLLDRVIWAYGQSQGSALYSVPAVQLDWASTGFPGIGAHRQLESNHPAHPQPRRRDADPARRRRPAEALLHRHSRRHRVPVPNHRERGRALRRGDRQHRQSRQRGQHRGTRRARHPAVRGASAAWTVPALCRDAHRRKSPLLRRRLRRPPPPASQHRERDATCRLAPGDWHGGCGSGHARFLPPGIHPVPRRGPPRTHGPRCVPTGCG